MQSRLMLFLATAAAAALLLPRGAFGETKTWSSATDGSWTDPLHWSPNGVPTTGDDVVVPGGSAFTLSLASNTQALSTLDFSCALGTLLVGNATLTTTSGSAFSGTLSFVGNGVCAGTLTTRSSSHTSFAPGAIVWLSGPLWTNDGGATLGASGATSNTYLRLAGHTTLAGAGSLRLLDPAHALFDNPAGWELTQGPGHTLAGTGLVSVPLHNQGALLADVAGQTLAVYALRDNTGVLRAANGGLLQIQSSSVAGTGGQYRAEGGDIEVVNSHLGGGTVSRTGTSLLSFTGSCSMADLTNTGLLRIPPGNNVTMTGASLVNTGTLEIGTTGGAGGAYLRPGAHVTVSGSGDIRLVNVAQSVFDSPGGWTVTQSAGHTTHGAGALTSPFNNAGTVAADVSGATLVLTGVKSNTGTFRATGGGLLSLSSVGLTNTGGQVIADGGDVELVNTTVVGGSLSSVGTNLVHWRNAALVDASLAGTQRMHTGTSASLGGSAIANAGRIEVGEAGMTSGAWLRPSAHVQLTGAGSVALIEEGYSVFDSPGGWTVTQAAAHSIRGAGVLTAPLVNHGTVRADVSGHTLLVSSTISNDGQMRATAGGTLKLQNMALANEGGHLAADGGTIELTNSTVHGGTIERTGTSLVHLRDGNTLYGFVSSAELRLHAGANVGLAGSGLQNDGTIVVNEAGETQHTWLRPAAHVTLSGSGEIVLANHDHAVFDSPGGYVVTQGASHAIRGTGWVTTPLVNHGLVSADEPGHALEMAGASTHDGACQAAYGATLNFAQWPANLASGTLTGGTWRAYAGSAIRFPGASITTNRAHVVLDGEESRLETDAQGHSALTAFATNDTGGSFAVMGGREFLTLVPFTNRGTLLVGDKSRFVVESAGLESAMSTDYAQEPAGALVIELAGRVPGRNGHVLVHGRARLAGTLRVVLADGFVPAIGDTFEVMGFHARDDAFTTYEGLDVAPGVWLAPRWSADRLVLVAVGQPNLDAPEPAGPSALAFGPAGPLPVRDLELALPRAADVRVELFDVSGRRVATLAAGALPAGRHRWTLPAAAGLWFARASVHDANGLAVRTARLVTWR